MFVLAMGLSGVFVALAVLHLYWARGGYWPGHDERSLMARVIGATPNGRMPSGAMCLAVAFVLFAVALIPLGLVGWVPLPFARELAYAGAAALLLRGIAGYADHRLRPATEGTPFVRLNRRVYSPLCLTLASGLLLLA